MSKRSYQCPACGASETVVWQTRAFSSLIMRERKCLVCGFKHKTVETRLDMDRERMDIEGLKPPRNAANLP